MRFSAATVLAFASAVLAQLEPTAGFDVVSKPTDQEKIPAGKAYEIVWAPSAEYSGKTVSIVLIGGPSQPKQDVLETIATGISSDAGKYSWSVDEDLGDLAVYGLKVVLDEDEEIFQYSFPFTITGGDHGDHSSAASSSAPASSTSAHSSKTTGYPHHSESTTLSSYVFTSTIYNNVSSTVTPSGTATESVPASTTASSTTTATSGVSTGAAGAYAANGLAVLGGFAAAMLAL